MLPGDLWACRMLPRLARDGMVTVRTDDAGAATVLLTRILLSGDVTLRVAAALLALPPDHREALARRHDAALRTALAGMARLHRAAPRFGAIGLGGAGMALSGQFAAPQVDPALLVGLAEGASAWLGWPWLGGAAGTVLASPWMTAALDAAITLAGGVLAAMRGWVLRATLWLARRRIVLFGLAQVRTRGLDALARAGGSSAPS